MSTTARPRVAIYSRRGVEQKVWHASQYEFEDVITEVEDAQLVLTKPLRGGEPAEWLHHGTNQVRKFFGMRRRSAMSATGHSVDADVFFAVFAAPHEIGALPYLLPQLMKVKTRIAFIVEMYMTDLPHTADYIRQLRGFDHIFVFTRDVLPAVREISGTRVSFLSTGIDALVFAPRVPSPARTTDVMSYGRRLDVTHAALRGAARDPEFYYHYDTVRGVFQTTDHRDHRAALAGFLQRSRYAVIYKNNDEASRIARTGGEETLTNRFFEATAAGAIILGSQPDVADFTDAFPWKDAIIPLPAPSPDVADIIATLDAQPDRLAEARWEGIRAGLERHDWSYRWQEILDAVGLTPHDRFADRVSALSARVAELAPTCNPRWAVTDDPMESSERRIPTSQTARRSNQ